MRSLLGHLSLGVVVALMGIACGDGDDGTVAPAPPPGTPSFYKDVEPILEVHCAGCHAADGAAGFAFDSGTAVSLASSIEERVVSRDMPPWPPGPLSPAIVNSRTLTEDQIGTISAWVKGGAPLGDPNDHVERSPKLVFDPGRPPDGKLTMQTAALYVPPFDNKNVNDEVRCFVMDLPPGTPSGWITAVRWAPGTPKATHHIGGMIVDAANAAAARARYGKDGRPGYECAGGFGDGITGVSGLGASGAGKDTGTMMPRGTGIYLPAGASVLMSVHYVVRYFKDGGSDQSSVELWFARPEERSALRPLTEHKLNAPSELPCPTGVSTDPNDPCSREWALANVPSSTPEKMRATNDWLLKSCKTSLPAFYSRLRFTSSVVDSFTIPTECEGEAPYDAVVHVVSNHMHTRGASSRIEAQRPDGSWEMLLDIPRWRWVWEASYLLERGIPVKKGQRLRVSCVFDNGDRMQWSQATNEPGHDQPAPAPRQPPHYVVAGPERGLDMCGATLTVERPAFKAATYPTICHEAQAYYDELCADGGVDFVTAPCEGENEERAVTLIRFPEHASRFFFCGPKGAGAAQGASCDLLSNCALACMATSKASGISEGCIAQCKANVNAYKPNTPATPASAVAAYRYGQLHACSEPACVGAADYKQYLECMTAACTDLAKWCYAK